MKNIMWIVLVWLMFQGVAQAASFDCAKAQSTVERLICADEELSKLDEDLGQAWKQHLRDNKFQDQFRRMQKHWIERRDACADVDCLKQTYQTRLQQMASGKEYFLREGQGESLCESLVQAMNEELYRPGHGRVCALDILQRMPGVQLPPWKKLDLQKNKEVYKRFILAEHVGEELWPSVFTDALPKAGQAIDPKGKRPRFLMPSEDSLNREWEYAVGAGFEFYRWDNAIPFPDDGDALLIRFTDPKGKECPTANTQLFRGDLKTPKSVVEYLIFDMIPFSFNDQWYWLSVSQSNALITDAFNIGQLTFVLKPYRRLDVCKVTSGQKSFKWE